MCYGCSDGPDSADTRCVPQLQFSGKVVDIPVVVQRLRRWFSTFFCIQQLLVRCCVLLRSDYCLCFRILRNAWFAVDTWDASILVVDDTIGVLLVNVRSYVYACHAVFPSLLLSSGPGCSASWSGWTRRTVIQRDRGRARRRQRQLQVCCWFCWVDAVRAVLFFDCRQARWHICIMVGMDQTMLVFMPFTLCSLCLSAPRSSSTTEACTWLVFSGDAAVCAVFPEIVVKPAMPGIMVFAASRKWPRSSSTTAVAWCVLVVDAPFVVQRQVPGLVQTVLNTVWRWSTSPCSCSVRAQLSVLTAEVPQVRSSTRS